jgi:hypothetical protein
MHSGICESYCPTGYTKNAGKCFASKPDELVMHYHSFTKLKSSVLDTAQYVDAKLGSDIQMFYPTPDNKDPMI